MVYKSFYIKSIIQVIFIIATCYTIGFLGYQKEFAHTIIGLHILLALQFIWLVRYVNRTNRMLSLFFESLKESGASIGFEKLPQSASFAELKKSIYNINDIIRDNRIEKENEHHYLKYLVEHLNTGILSIVNETEIDLINQAGLQILNTENIFKLDDLKDYGQEFYNTIRQIRAGDQSLSKAIIKNEIILLSIQASEFKLFEKQIKLISFHDINQALDQKEIEAWQKVIKVLAHEIHSSVSPIRSLSGHLENLLNKSGEEQLNYIGDAQEGLQIIHERSEGLMKFVDTYRKLSDIPTVNLEIISIKSLINKLKVICETEFELNPQITIEEGSQKINIKADKNLLIQSCINILRNASQAVTEKSNPVVEIKSKTFSNKVLIQITDNGTGIDNEDLENVFIPFFTTKQDGSGIGLTIARQLVTMQGGRLEITSKKGIGTTITISFNYDKY